MVAWQRQPCYPLCWLRGGTLWWGWGSLRKYWLSLQPCVIKRSGPGLPGRRPTWKAVPVGTHRSATVCVSTDALCGHVRKGCWGKLGLLVNSSRFTIHYVQGILVTLDWVSSSSTAQERETGPWSHPGSSSGRCGIHKNSEILPYLISPTTFTIKWVTLGTLL